MRVLVLGCMRSSFGYGPPQNEQQRLLHFVLRTAQPRRAASILATSILFICIIASKARLAAAVSGPVIASVRAIGVICQDKPHLSVHQPHAFSCPPLPTIAF